MRKVSFSLGVFTLLFNLLAALPSAWGQDSVFISEFMASNNGPLKDEDGEYSDWIELYNASSNTVNLDGWFLTDSARNLNKWRFPAANIGAYSYLVVFASNKDRTNAGAPLHTNFRLDAARDFLGLVKPDGATVVSQYSPQYPDQRPGVSYGLGMVPGVSSFLVRAGDTAQFLVPSQDIGGGWTALGYTPTAAWSSGATALGYDTGTNYAPALVTDLGAQMTNGNSSVYMRLPFTVADPGLFQNLRLRMRYDDGFVAYLNGTEVVRANAPASVAWNSTAPTRHGSEPGVAGRLRADFDTVTNTFTPRQQNAAPAPSIQVGDTGSAGRFLRLLTDGANDNLNNITFDRTAPGVYPMITADFDFRITDTAGNPADGFSFLLIPTATYGATGMGLDVGTAAEEPNFSGVFAIGFDVYPATESRNDVSVHWGAELQNVTIPRADFYMVASAAGGFFHRAHIVLTYVPGGATLSVTITPNINGTPGTPITVIDRLSIPGLPQFESRVEFAGRTGGANMSVDLDNIDVQFGYPTGVMPSEDFLISSALPLLRPGQNVLAIQGLNLATNDPDFFLEPELIARSVEFQSNVAIFFTNATPGDINAGGQAESAPKALFSVPSGVYTNNLSVALSSTLTNAVIRYTLNGTRPTESSPVYMAPLNIATSAIVRAVVYAPGYFPSEPETGTYTLLETNMLGFSSGLPVVILDTFGQTVVPDMIVKAPANLTVIDVSQITGRATPVGQPDYHGRVGLEGRGQTSWSGYEVATSLGGRGGIQKRPYNIEIRDEFDNDKEVDFLDLPPGSDWVLLNVYNDKSFLNDFLANELFEKMGHYSVRRRYVEVFWNGIAPEGNTTRPDTSGKVGTNDYAGLYLLLEKIRIDNDRVNIQKPQTGDPGDPITGGYIWKKDKNSPGDYNFATPNQPILSTDALKFHDPRGEQLTAVQRFWLTDYLTNFEAVLYGPNWRDPINGYTKWIDVDSFVDAHWIVEYTKQIDGYRLSSYFHMDRGGKIKWSPIWDWNLSFGNANYAEGGLTNGWYYPLIGAYQHIWERRLISEPGDPDYNQRLIDRWAELRRTICHPTNMVGRIDAITNYIFEAAMRDFARWPRLDRYLWPNPDGNNLTANDSATGVWHVNYAVQSNYSGIIGDFKKWVVGHTAWIDGQYLPPPALSRYAGYPAVPLNIYAPTGTVYYTTDGSDPRLPGGRVSPNALAYTSAIPLPSNARIFARTWMTNSWSAPAKADFAYPTPALAISEIMYHPAGPPPGLATNDEQFEFIELVNTSASPIDLTGVRLAGGANFLFPPGPLTPTGTPTTNDFDATGTAYAGRTLGSGSGASVGAGPSGNLLQLTALDTGTNRNRIAFDRTASGLYDRIVAEFDFRATNASPAPTMDVPTVLDFDSAGTPFVIANFDADASTPVVMADAGSTNNFVRLTKTVASESGGVYLNATEVGTNRLVLINFDFRIAGAADGMGFVFLNTATGGTNGAGSAFAEEPNLTGSIGFGFDIYNNGNPPTDYNANHVSLHYGTMVSAPPATPNLNLAAGQWHRANITIKFETSRALITLKITPNILGGGGAQETLYDNFIINGVTPYRGRLAFCGRTGGSNANQDVDNVNVLYYADAMVPAGFSLALLPTAAFGVSGAGSTTATYAEVPSATNLFALNFDVHASDTINDANIYWNAAQRGGGFIPPATLSLDSGAFHHARLEVNRASEGSYATLVLSPDIYGASGPALTVFSNLYLAGYLPTDSRVEFAGRSGGQNVGFALDNVNVQFSRYEPNLFAPGERLLLVKNRAAFESRYGASLPVFGEYVGSLNNAGDHLVLYGRYGEPILDFRYGDGWYPVTDGAGFSLVLANSSTNSPALNNPASWRPSAREGGSPGVADSTPAAVVPVLITEVLTHSNTNLIPGIADAIELFNPSRGEAADVSYWYLTDDFNTPRKFQIPADTVIPAGGYLVFDESAFNASPGAPTSFALGSEGEEVFLFSGDAGGNLTGYVTGDTFRAADPNVSFGRHVTSQGNVRFVAQAARTLGTNNAVPLVGPVVISEIMYRPPDFPVEIDNSIGEYIELANLTAGTVPLYDPSNPANTWQLRDAVDFTFPVGTTLPPLGRVLVVNFNPVTQPDLLAWFLAQYNFDAGVSLFGPYGGKLANNQENVELVKRVQIVTNAGPTDVLVDKVDYEDNSPWPLAGDGLGYSLQRLALDQYGNDPINWIAAPPTPAAANMTSGAPTIAVQPVSQVVLANNPVTFSVTADGPGPFTYQWRYSGSLLPGATDATLLLPAVQIAQAGNYQVVVMNSAGAVDSAVATLTVYQAASVLVAPTNRTIWPGSNTTFTVSALGNGPVAYQWQFNGANLAGMTNTSLTLTNGTPANAGDYTVVLTDGVGPAQATARLSFFDRPLFTVQPTNRTVTVGITTVNVTNVASAFSSTPVRYQWRFDGADIPNATNASYIISDVQVAHSGSYSVVASDSYGSAVSTNAVLAAVRRPAILQQPIPRAVVAYVGGTASYTVIVSNNATLPLGYRWRRNGAGTNVMFDGFTNTLTLTNVQLAQAGAYDVAITNIAGGTTPATSARSFLTVMEVLADRATTLGGNATFRLVITNGNPSGPTNTLNYAWWFQATNLLASGTNLTFTSLTVSNVQASNFGPYTVVITNAAGISATQTATLSLAEPPVITGQPTNQTVSAGADASFNVTVTGSAPLGYQWWFNGTNAVLGGTESLLTLSNAQPAQAGGYHVIVSNIVGSVTSQVATLTVTLSEPPRFDGIIAATSPTEPVTMSFTAQPGQTYSVLYSDTLTNPAWLVLTNIGPLGTAQPVTARDADVVGKPQRFYRIVTPAQP
ncbi:MAG: lamin tail domain-containing protein [Verrucomicrobia bacterium]|nr:lamin tail domain-containing protein [Verrucomicrobiota bacterium]